MSFKKMLVGASMACCFIGAVSVKAQMSASVQKESEPTLFVCYNGECFSSGQKKINKESVMRLGTALFQNSQRKKITLCEANPQTLNCLTPGIQTHMRAGVSDVMLSIPSLIIERTENEMETSGIQLVTAYQVQANNTYPHCSLVQTSFVKKADTNQMVLTPVEMLCRLTESFKIPVAMEYRFDYFDFDRKIIGGYYEISVGKIGGYKQDGYVLMQFPYGLSLVTETEEETLSEKDIKTYDMTSINSELTEIISETIPSTLDLTEGGNSVKIKEVASKTDEATEKTADVYINEVMPKKEQITEEYIQEVIPMKKVKTTVTEKTTIVPAKGKGGVPVPSTRTIIPGIVLGKPGEVIK